MSSQFKVCVECESLFGPKGDKNFSKKKFCTATCMHAAKKFAPRRAARMFWPKIDQSGGPNACWPYYRTDAAGYGRFAKQGPYAFAHRTAYLLTKGMIPDGLDVLHSCDNRACCNPNHLRVGTHSENMVESLVKGRKSNQTPPDKVREVRRLLAEIPPGRGQGKRIEQLTGVRAEIVSGIKLGMKYTYIE